MGAAVVWGLAGSESAQTGVAAGTSELPAAPKSPDLGLSDFASNGTGLDVDAPEAKSNRAPGTAFPNPSQDEKVPVGWVSTHARVLKHEALPCTGIEDPINFKIFSAGRTVAGLALNDVTRRCDRGTPADERPANFTNYIYGDCEIAAGATGCQPPLQIQSFPACQRSLADYSLEGEPLPYKELERIGEAVVVEIDLMGERRIEIYTGSTTIVIFATEADLARQVLDQLRAQERGSAPATHAAELNNDPEPSLPAPRAGAIKGELPCRS